MSRHAIKYWERLGKRLAPSQDFLGALANGDHESGERLLSLIHTLKGEAQLLGIEPTGEMLEAINDVLRFAITSPEATTVASLGNALSRLSSATPEDPMQPELTQITDTLADLRRKAQR